MWEKGGSRVFCYVLWDFSCHVKDGELVTIRSFRFLLDWCKGTQQSKCLRIL